MAVTFTSMADWEHAQDTDAAQEIVLAYSERRQCVGDSAIDDLASGNVRQNTAFWQGMQQWVESKCARWVDDSSFSTSTEYDSVADIAHTLTTFRTEAGIPDGFRRATTKPTDWTDYEDAAFSYGVIQQGDIIGPWIFEDLQKAFDAMRWTWDDFADSYENALYKYTGVGLSYSLPTRQDAYDLAETYWPVDFAATNQLTAYMVQLSLTHTPTVTWRVGRSYADAVFSGIPTHINHAAAGYYHFHGPTVDVDGVGAAHKKFLLRQTYESGDVESRTILQLEYVATMPPYNSADYETGGLNMWEVMIFKWEFTNTL